MSYQVKAIKNFMSKGQFEDRDYVQFTKDEVYNCEELTHKEYNVDYYYIYNEDKSIWSTFNQSEFEMFFEKL